MERRKGSDKSRDFSEEMNVGCVEVDEVLDSFTEFLSFDMERKYLIEVLELKGLLDRNEGFLGVIFKDR